VAACYIERVIGAIRRECLDRMIVFNERCLLRHLEASRTYYHRSRIRLALEKDSPEHRPVQATDAGRIIAIPEVGGLHHRYERRAAWKIRIQQVPVANPLSLTFGRQFRR
jgi:putative transposase